MPVFYPIYPSSLYPGPMRLSRTTLCTGRRSGTRRHSTRGSSPRRHGTVHITARAAKGRAVGVLVSTVFLIVRSNAVVRVLGVVGRGIDTDLDPREETILQSLTQVQVFREGIVLIRRLHNTPHVVRVGGDGLRSGVVRGGIFDSGAKDLVPEELADVGDGAGADFQGAIGVHGCVEMR